MKRMLSLLVALCMLLVVTAGCGGGDQSQSTEPQQQSSAAPASQAGPTEAAGDTGENISLRMVWWGGDSRHEATLKMIDNFTQNIMPNVTIEGEYLGWDGYYEKLTAGLMAGTAPDIIQNNVRFINSLYTAGDFFVDLEELGDIDLTTFDATFLDNQGRQPDGKLIGVPTGMNSRTMLVNKDFFAKYGIEYDKRWTWDDLFEAAQTVRATDPDNYLIWNVMIDVQFPIFGTYTSQITGNNWANDDYTPGITQEAIEQGLTLLKRMVDEGVLVPLSVSNMSVGSEDNGFRKGTCGITVESASAIAVYNDMNTDVVNLPILPDAKQSAIGIESSQIMSIPLSCKYPHEAGRFIQYMLNEQEGVEIGGTQRGIPASSAAMEILQGLGMLNPVEVKAMELGMAEAGKPYTGVDQDTRIAELRQRYIEQVMGGEATPQDAAADLYAQTVALLEEMKADAGA